MYMEQTLCKLLSKNVMVMSPFGILNEVWCIKLHRGIVGSLSLILAIKIMFVQTQEFRELRDVLHKPSL